MSNINIKHFYLNIRINNEEKLGITDQRVLFETRDHYNVKYKY